MKKLRLIVTVMTFCASLMLAMGGISVKSSFAYIQGNLPNESLTTNRLFSDKQIETSGYLYNYDGSPDYIFADFVDSTGYAIFAEETMELLEYTMIGDFPYPETNGMLIYGGPQSYFVKNENVFRDIISNENFLFEQQEAVMLSQNTREKIDVSVKTLTGASALTEPEVKLQNFISENKLLTNSVPQTPPLDTSEWISPTSGATYITNSEYFLTEGQAPKHGNNAGTTCTAVATQLMLSYNNYYNDRRIILPEYLFGGWDSVSNNGDIFDPTNYANRNRDPNVCTNYASMTSWTLGSNQDFHDMLVDIGVTGYLHDAEGNLRSYLNDRLGENNFLVESQEETTLPFGMGVGLSNI